jgi:hypothetical protein
MITRTISSILLILCLASLVFAKAATPQRDHLTPQEVDIVKEAQILDQRIEVFIKAAERRLLVLNGTKHPPDYQAIEERVRVVG